MNITRRYNKMFQKCIIITDKLMSVAVAEALFDEAKKDFPDLKPENVMITMIGGEAGIMFEKAESQVPETYRRV